VLELAGDRPLTINRVADLHRMQVATLTRKVRNDWAKLARDEHIPALTRAVITATPLHADRRSPQDACACAPASKAAVDGLVDAGVLPDDNGAHLPLVLHTAPDICGHNGLRLLIEELHP
jgi:hypothetical protein